MASITAESSVLASLSVDVTGGGQVWTVISDPATEPELHIFGLKPETTYALDLTLVDDTGATSPVVSGEVETAPLPVDFPFLEVVTATPALMEPGLTLFGVTAVDITTSVGSNFAVMANEAGEVVWYLRSDDLVGDMRFLDNGNLLFLGGGNRLATEVTLVGDIVGSWWAAGLGLVGMPAGAIPVPVDTLHHEIIPLFDEPAGVFEGDFLALSSELLTLPDYPIDEVDTTMTEPEASVIADVIVEFTREGDVVKTWPLAEVLDPYRICYGSLFSFWDSVYLEETRDWSHGNAVILVDDGASLLVSLRHQEALVKLDYATGDVIWILGAPGRWTAPLSTKLVTPLNGGFEWFYHQHAPMLTTAGTIVLFDNGNGRAIPPAPELAPEDTYSRAVELSVDESPLTVEEMWSFGPDELDFYSPALGDADVLESTGNVLICNGNQPVDGQSTVQILEVTTGPAPEIVFELRGHHPDMIIQQFAYRAERVPALVPGTP